MVPGLTRAEGRTRAVQIPGPSSWSRKISMRAPVDFVGVVCDETVSGAQIGADVSEGVEGDGAAVAM
jgi:hypothetical protein